ncbi:hypothetical protein EOE18_17325 [Novosphingobium umbonatum]|uniref:C-deglycosylation enzyme beta subunit n=1 Tax=Novosphingobium umbonatum TaxID=1908524 RepID=A0A3S3TJ59_9SPHN|nr:DUF6379 domain-containing protein [Novosphingobium umbonatum]RVU02274.1 hypothetical protein EOE18_17325 [Novosphingobium umbonatum]
MMDHRVVSDGGLFASASGFDVDVRLPWYRSLPLSVVEVVEVALDGHVIALENVTFELNGETLRPAELRPRTDDYWYVLDSALLHVAHAPVAQGSTHEVCVTIAVRPPYIQGLNRIVKTTKTLTAR